MNLTKHNYFTQILLFMLCAALFQFCFFTMPVWAADLPTITTQPASVAVTVGQSASFSVAATGIAPLSYQWKRNGSNISGATSATLNIPNAQRVNFGNYTVVVSDSKGNSVTSNAAALTAIKITTIGSGESQFFGVAVDGSGNIYTTDHGNSTNGWKGTINKMVVSDNKFSPLSSDFNRPYGIAVDGGGNIYVADIEFGYIKKMDASGKIIGYLGYNFKVPYSVAVDGSGNIYVADYNNNAIKKMNANGDNPVAVGPSIGNPFGVAVDSGGNIYATDTVNHAIVKMDANGKNLVTLCSAFKSPTSVALDKNGNIYVADFEEKVIKKMDANGKNLVALGSDFKAPIGVAVDSSGNIYVADQDTTIKKIQIITCIDVTVNSPAVTGFTVALSPALPGLTTANFTLLDNMGNPVTIAGAATSDNGATYVISAVLTAGQSYTVTASKSGYDFGSPQSIAVPLVKYQGAQKRLNADGTYDIRFIATIDTLDADSVGFVFSKSVKIPAIENVPSSQVKSTTTVYKSVTALGSTVTAESLGGTYIIACTVTNIPAADINIPLYVRAFSKKGTDTIYTPVKIVTVNGL